MSRILSAPPIKNYSQELKNEISTELYSDLVDKIIDSDYENSYGGAYINDDGELVVRVCDDVARSYFESLLPKQKIKESIEKKLNENLEDIKIILEGSKQRTLAINDEVKSRLEFENKTIELMKEYNVIYLNSHYSVSYLNLIRDTLKKIAKKYGIWYIASDVVNNSVEVYVCDINVYDEIVEFLDNEINGFSTDAVHVREVEKTSSFTADYYAYGGRKITDKRYEWTIGFNAFDENGDYGIVTCGHTAADGTKVYNENNKLIGKVTLNSFDQGLDAAFVRFDNSLFVKWISTYNVSEVGSYIYNYLSEVATDNQYVVGARIERYGISSGLTVGKILQTEAVYTDMDSGITYDNLILYDNAPEEGDSGGPIVISTGRPKCKRYLAGINSLYFTLYDGRTIGAGPTANAVLNELDLTAVTTPD